MYVNPAIRFRDPFSSKDSATHNSHRSSPGWSSRHHYPDINRVLTPPPEMNNAPSAAPNSSQNVRVYGHGYTDYMPAQNAYRAPTTAYAPQEPPSRVHGRNGYASSDNSRASPVRHVAIESNMSQAQQRRPSHHDAIATNFQIPRSVNDSGGSLSELAAQVSTSLCCLHV